MGNLRAIVFEHAEHEGAGLVGQALQAHGVQLDRRRLHLGDPLPESPESPTSIAEYDAVLAMGGPMAAWQDAEYPFLAGEARLLAAAARAGVPTLGICLGSQLLARGLGARGFAGPAPEIGIYPLELTEAGQADPLLQPFAGSREGDAFHWHQDTFDLPPGAVHLARSARFAHQAYRLGARAYGLQFHPECDQAMRTDWARRHADQLRALGLDPASFGGTRELDERGRALGAAFARLLRTVTPI